jgi:hypothetical protein
MVSRLAFHSSDRVSVSVPLDVLVLTTMGSSRCLSVPVVFVPPVIHFINALMPSNSLITRSQNNPCGMNSERAGAQWDTTISVDHLGGRFTADCI